jgi:hypothetical protein
MPLTSVPVVTRGHRQPIQLLRRFGRYVAICCVLDPRDESLLTELHGLVLDPMLWD